VGRLRILTYPGNEILLRPARRVTRINRRVQRLAGDMLETLHAAGGAGLAAPQVGAAVRVIVADVGQGPIVLINPEISEMEGEQIGLEGCLSLPDLVGEVRRAERLAVCGLDRSGQAVTLQGEGLLARVLQHEIDHLDGILYIARLTEPGRLWKAADLEGTGQEEAIDI
jgi:peptide deformylase